MQQGTSSFITSKYEPVNIYANPPTGQNQSKLYRTAGAAVSDTVYLHILDVAVVIYKSPIVSHKQDLECVDNAKPA